MRTFHSSTVCYTLLLLLLLLLYIIFFFVLFCSVGCVMGFTWLNSAHVCRKIWKNSNLSLGNVAKIYVCMRSDSGISRRRVQRPIPNPKKQAHTTHTDAEMKFKDVVDGFARCIYMYNALGNECLSSCSDTDTHTHTHRWICRVTIFARDTGTARGQTSRM